MGRTWANEEEPDFCWWCMADIVVVDHPVIGWPTRVKVLLIVEWP